MRRLFLFTTCFFIACGTSRVVTNSVDHIESDGRESVTADDGDEDVVVEASTEGGSRPSRPQPPADRARRAPDSEPTSAPDPSPSKHEVGDVSTKRAAKLGGHSDKPSEPIVSGVTKPVKTPRASPPPPPPRRAVASPGVKAGAADDNLQYGAFLEFLEKNDHHGYHRDVSDRVIVEVKDAAGLPVHGADVHLAVGRRRAQKRRTYADGRTLVFPSQAPAGYRQDLAVVVRYRGEEQRVAIGSRRSHIVEVRLKTKRVQPERMPLDIAFVLDTTGSMGDEILRLKQTLEAIHFQIANLSPAPDLRIGMVLYRDQGDEYVVQHVPFTGNVDAFAAELARVQAGGGNDYPEDVQAGLEVALHKLKWRQDGVQIAFLVGDAPPHTDYDQMFTYQHAAQEAAERGIKIATIGASGLSEMGELVWRQIAQYTMSPFVFLTYGETGDSGAGSPAMVSHHIGSNWVAENLDAIIVRMVKVELAHLSPRGAPVREDFFSATSAEEIPADTILEDLFARSVKQLLDYSVEQIAPRTPTVLMPVAFDKTAAGSIDKLERRLMVGLSRRSQFQLLESEDQKKLLAALAEQLSEKYDASGLTEVGKLVPAELAVLSSVAPGKKGQVEMLVKLVRLQTGEVLSLSLLKIDESLVL